jgi:hypothetical protein
VLSVHHYIRKPKPQDARNQLSQLSVTENGCALKTPNIDLRKDFASGGERFDKDSLFVTYVFRNAMKIFERQGKIFGKGAVAAENSEYRAPRTMSFEATPAKGTNWAISKG